MYVSKWEMLGCDAMGAKRSPVITINAAAIYSIDYSNALYLLFFLCYVVFVYLSSEQIRFSYNDNANAFIVQLMIMEQFQSQRTQIVCEMTIHTVLTSNDNENNQ